MFKWKVKSFIAVSSCLLGMQMASAQEPFSADELSVIKQYLFQNITTKDHPFIKNDSGHLIHSIPGAVLASPSNKGPNFSQDYQFHWTRDAALTMQEVLFLYQHATNDEKKRLKTYLLNYVEFETKAQKQISKPNEQTLGQPKFNVDGTIWEGQWGRPQNDGPGLRAQVMTQMAYQFINEKDEAFVKTHLLSLIKADINYVLSEWRNTNFDLWEEVSDPEHFFNQMVQRKALNDAASLFSYFGERELEKSCLETAAQMTDALNKHWNASLGYFTETINQQNNKGGGLDTSIILGVLYGQIQAQNDPFALTDDRVLSSIYYIRNAFSGLYQVNLNSSSPTLLGRYPSDIYDGKKFVYGNPWVLTTNALAEFYYSLASTYMKQGSIKVTNENILFFKQINENLVNQEGVIVSTVNPKQFNNIINALMAEGDKILQNVKTHSICYKDRSCLHFSEQIDRASGEAVSAKDLTWGYTTVLRAMQARSSI